MATATESPKASKTETKAKATGEKKARKPVERKIKPKHPLVGSTDPKVYPFTTENFPSDFVHGKFADLIGEDFVDDASFYDYRTSNYQWKADKFRAKAEEARTVGTVSKEDKASIKKLIREAARLKELQAILGGKGFNVEELMAKAAKAIA